MNVGMMISAFSKAGQVLDDASYLQRALEAVQFVQRELYQRDSLAAAVSGRLVHSCYVDSSTAQVAHRSDRFDLFFKFTNSCCTLEFRKVLNLM